MLKFKVYTNYYYSYNRYPQVIKINTGKLEVNTIIRIREQTFEDKITV